MKNISNFNINENDLAAVSAVRQFTVAGEKDASFILQVFNSSQQFYNFKSRSFSATHTSTSSLKIKMSGNTYSNSINFPANGSGDTYTVLLIAPPDKDTELSFGKGKHSYSTTITQVADSTLTFTPATTNDSSYKTFPSSVTSTATPTATSSIIKQLDWDVVNTDSDANGFGLRLIRQPINTDWYYTTEETVDGAVSSSTEIIVDDLTDLATGMYITGISGGSSLSGTPTITAIDTGLKKLTMSSAQTFVDNTVLTFQARGSSVIKKAIGADIDFSTWNANVTSAKSAELTQIVRGDTSSTTIALNDTYGIAGKVDGSGVVTVSGANIINTGDNTVQTVTADVGGGGGDGAVVVQISQTAAQGTKLYFTGSTQTVTIANNIIINKNPSSNKIIYLNLDNFITPGVSGLE